MDEEGIDQAALAFYINYPYLPRPGHNEWDDFKELFVSSSGKMLQRVGDVPVDFPVRLIQRSEYYATSPP